MAEPMSWIPLWWNLLNSGFLVLAVSIVLYLLNRSFQKKLTKSQFQNDAFIRFGVLGQEMWLLVAYAQKLHGNPTLASTLMEVRLGMLYKQGGLRTIRLPLLLHFDDSDETIAQRLKRMGEIYEEFHNMLNAQTLNPSQYEGRQNEFHEVYGKLYGDLALRIEKGRKASAAEVDHAAKIAMARP